VRVLACEVGRLGRQGLEQRTPDGLDVGAVRIAGETEGGRFPAHCPN
jgi:hypothetical protein